MSLDNPKVIDAIGLENATDTVVLTIVDSWGWENESVHLYTLQDKLNSYFEFVESKQIFEEYPIALGRNLRIDVIGKHPLPRSGELFFKQACDVAKELELAVIFKLGRSVS